MTKTTTKTKDPKNTLYPLIAFRLDAGMAKQIELASKEMGVSKSKLIKSAIEQYLVKRKK
jgi:predicted DNA-binding protein